MQLQRLRIGLLGLGAAAMLLVLTACTAGPGIPPESGTEVAGFWPGLWHGLIAPITFIVSLFNSNVSIYEVHNNGGWYDFGFLFGLSIVFGGMGGGGFAARGGRSK
ncbi:hypothetical protein [Gulosibacter molinativorax]|uniref:Cell division protein CrgA n=1 Tax=Gulosibacter molinativorax TaxID=256821 RepID=A0ABT7C6T6_9MICO|nr:hypothetical protein [Gulosibacter molinativorax]MDJ1370908.1 hypothetical protein [Gulosibacter molinativorax]QUY62245.1 Uncharacterised protein [Gulosibacter molinativorax]